MKNQQKEERNMFEVRTDLALEEQERLQEQQTIDRAKWVLVDQRKMSEPDAHRYIEKSAMDRCVRKIRIAEEILRDS